MKLTNLLEDSIGTISAKINVVVKIDKTHHASDRQSRHEEFISNKDIITAANKALPKISKMLIFDKLDIGDTIIIYESSSYLNLVSELREGSGVIDLVVITVMKNKNFKSPPGTKYVRV